MHEPARPQLCEQQGGNSEEWNVAECLRILFLRKTTLLWITGMGALGAALITAGQTPVYQSRASLEIQAFNDNFLNLRDVFPAASLSTETGPYIQTQTELLQQDAVLEAAARTLHVERRPEFQPASKSLGKLRKDVRIVAVRNSRIIQIVADARDAAFAAELANTVAETFIEQGIESRQRAARETYESLRPQVEEARRELARQEARGARAGRRTEAGFADRRSGREPPLLRSACCKRQTMPAWRLWFARPISGLPGRRNRPRVLISRTCRSI